MVKFDNIQQALDYSIGTIEGASEELTVRDYLKVVNSSTAIGRLFTQLKLLYNGKGWVNDKVATGMLQSQKLETLMSIQSLCDQILDPSKTPGNGSARGPESQRPLKVTSKDPLLGSQAKDRSEKSMEKKEIQGLHDLVCEVKNCRYTDYYWKLNLTPIKPESYGVVGAPIARNLSPTLDLKQRPKELPGSRPVRVWKNPKIALRNS